MAKKNLISSIAEDVKQTELSHGENVKQDSQSKEHTPTIQPSNPTPRYLSYKDKKPCVHRKACKGMFMAALFKFTVEEYSTVKRTKC